MAIDKRLARQIKRLNRAIQKLVAQSPEFSDLRKLLREDQVELAVYVVPMVSKLLSAKQDDIKFELTDADRRFLRDAGIEFDA